MLGKKIFLPLFGRRYPRLSLDSAFQFIGDLDLDIVGGLVKNDSTTNDIDIVGNKDHVEIFANRVKKGGVSNPVHYCGPKTNHSHLSTILNGIKLAVTGQGF